jgi:hypothetical protein
MGYSESKYKKSFPVSHSVSNVSSRFHAFFLPARGNLANGQMCSTNFGLRPENDTESFAEGGEF